MQEVCIKLDLDCACIIIQNHLSTVSKAVDNPYINCTWIQLHDALIDKVRILFMRFPPSTSKICLVPKL